MSSCYVSDCELLLTLFGSLIVFGALLIWVILFILAKMSGRTIGHVLAEIKYEIIYNILGMKAILDDFAFRDKNVVEVSPVGTGKVALVTGGARGIGVEVVKKLVKCEYQVIIGCRNIKAGHSVIKNMKAEGMTDFDVCVYELDLDSIKSITLFASEVKQNHPKIHLLINNAGKMFGPYMETEDGYESQFGINYLGHFLLTHLLLPQIKAAGTTECKSRIVNVSSCAHLCGEIDFDDINQRVEYISSKAYAQSKLAQILFSNYLNTRLKNEQAHVAVYAIHPGIVNTELFNGTILRNFAPWIPRLFFMTPEQGAATIIFTCISPTLERLGGYYLSNCQIIPTSTAAYSFTLQAKLFEFTNKLLNIQEFGNV